MAAQLKVKKQQLLTNSEKKEESIDMGFLCSMDLSLGR